MTQYFKKLLFPPNARYLLTFGEFHLVTVSVKFPEINYTVAVLPFYYFCGVFLKINIKNSLKEKINKEGDIRG